VSPLLNEMKETFGDLAFAAFEAGNYRLGCAYHADEDSWEMLYKLFVPGRQEWIEVERHEHCPDALWAMARRIHQHRHKIPVDRRMQPSPTFVIAREKSLEVVYLTKKGVCDAEELLDAPSKLLFVDGQWSDIRSAIDDIANQVHSHESD
jgi:hypothetical protein